MPQAGVALGMALVARERLPALADAVLPVVIVASVIFELVGPLLTRIALGRVGESLPGEQGLRAPTGLEAAPHSRWSSSPRTGAAAWALQEFEASCSGISP